METNVRNRRSAAAAVPEKKGPDMTDLQEQILQRKKEKNAVILAHYYQTMDIQNVADFVGDSFELALRAQEATQDVLVLCGVRFMAESAKLLNPEKTVLLPVQDAGCPMADMITPAEIRKLRAEYPDAAVMCYINSSAAVKAECDICCTSSSAVRIARSLREKRVIFVPDQNLGAYVAAMVPEKEFILSHGFCPVHQGLTAEDVRAAKAAHPSARVLVHPECPAAVLERADLIGSTSAILKEVEQASDREFLIGTETGVVERLRQTAPDKTAYLMQQGLVCADMKKIRAADVLRCLDTGTYEISLPAETMQRAARSLRRMVAGNAYAE